MNEIAKLKAKEERRRLESEVRIETIVTAYSSMWRYTPPDVPRKILIDWPILSSNTLFVRCITYV